MADVQQLSASPLNRNRVEIQFCITGLGQKQGTNGKPNLRQKIKVILIFIFSVFENFNFEDSFESINSFVRSPVLTRLPC